MDTHTAGMQESELELLPPNSCASALQSEANPRASSPAHSSVIQKGWPDQPQRLKRNASKNKLSTVISCIVALLPFIFLGKSAPSLQSLLSSVSTIHELIPASGLAISVIAINGYEVNDRRDAVVQATHLGPTILPIVFAAIVGSLMRSYALWRAQNGAALGLIEQLNGSTSFAGTIELAIALRLRDPLMVLILVLWAMSPLGGQAALRMISEVQSSVPGDLSVAYLDLNVSATNVPLAGGSSTEDIMAPLSAIYTTLLVSSEEAKASPRDVWGWPKIPNLSLISSASAGADGSWRSVPEDGMVSYTSLVGHVLQGIPPDGYAEFPIESSYFDFDCHMVATGLSANQTFDAMGGRLLHHNASNFFDDRVNGNSEIGTVYSNFFIDTPYNITAPSRSQSHVTLFYGSKDRNGQGNMYGSLPVALFNCTMAYIRIEANVACENSSCAVTRLRRSQKDPLSSSSYSTPFNSASDHWFNSQTTVNHIITWFPHAVPLIDIYHPSPTDSYIYGDTSFFNASYYRDWRSVSAKNFSTRFTTLFNTFYQTSLATGVIPSAGLSDPVDLNTSYPSYLRSESTTYFKMFTVYQINLFWLIIFIVASTLLLLSALAGLFLKSIIVAPDILGFVSSLTRDNLHVPLPSGGSALSGEDRAKMLRDLPVQLADVEEHRDFGRIALVSLSGDTMCKKLQRHRQYE